MANRLLVGETYGKLTVLSLRKTIRGLVADCLCDCGSELSLPASRVGARGYKSCGCSRYEREKTSVVERFMEKVDKSSSEQGCWLWTGSVDRSGYGRIDNGTGKLVSVHRLSYTHFHGPIPERMEVCHVCDVRNCVNPAHLFIGTHKENLDDMRNKGRSRDSRGEKNPRAKLRESDVIEIHRLISQGTTQTEIARKYGVNRRTISHIATRSTWKQVSV